MIVDYDNDDFIKEEPEQLDDEHFLVRYISEELGYSPEHVRFLMNNYDYFDEEAEESLYA